MADTKIQTVAVQQEDLRALYTQASLKETVYPVPDAQIQAHQIMYSNEREISLNAVENFTNSVKLSSYNSLIRNTIVELIFTATGNSTILQDYTAYNFLKEVEWAVQGTEQHKRKSPQLINSVLEMCESDSKKDKILSVAGRRDFLAGAVANGDVLRLYALLPLPFADLKIQNKKKPFPSYLLSEPIELKILFGAKADIFGTPANVTFTSARILYEYGKMPTLENYEKPSVETTENGSLIQRPIIYPFVSYWDHSFNLVATTAGDTAIPQVVELNQFRKGECVELLFLILII